MSRYRWVVLGVGTLAQASQSATYSGLAVLAPALQRKYDLSLTEVGLMLGLSSTGVMLTLIPWGMLVDRVGERPTAAVGLAGSGAAVAGAAFAPSFAWLVAFMALSSAFGGSINSATGRAVMTWFARDERGFALGLRQTAIPLAGFATGLGLPAVVAASGTRAALLVLAGVLGGGSLVCAAALRDRGGRTHHEEDVVDVLRHPLRDPRLWRLSLGGALIVVTQISITGFTVLFLHEARGLSEAQAGAVLAVLMALGAASRIAAGRWSDRLGARVEPIRRLAVGVAATVAVVAALADAPLWLLVPALVLAGGLSMSWNGLMFTAAAEIAGRRRSGAAIGLQQTSVHVGDAVAPLAFAPLVAATTWQIGYAAIALLPLLGVLVLRPVGR